MSKRIIFFSEDQEYGTRIEKSLRASHEFVYGGWFQSFSRLVYALKTSKPEILLMEISRKSDLSAIDEVKKYARSISVIVISPNDDHESIKQSLKAGAHGYLIKYMEVEETMYDLFKLARGGVALSATAAKSIVKGFWKSNNSPLTQTETKVLKFVSLGHTYSSLAKNLDIAKGTAKTHLKNIYRKLNIHRKSEALERAYLEKLIN